MTSTVTTGLWHRFDHAEHALCLRVNRGCQHVPTRRLFVTVSRLGDGILWYVLMLAFALSGPQGALVAAQMGVAGVAGTTLYRQLKHRLVRERPFISYASIQSGTAPLDRYSFPSGHTLHAVSFTLIATTHVPQLALLLVPFAGGARAPLSD
jgi:undecaprenyl-diphosphatase